MFSRGVGGWEVGWRGQCWFAVSEGEEFFARGLLWVCEWIDFRLICGGMRGRFFAPFAEICGNIAEAHSSRFPTFLSGERKVYKRSAFSAPRALRRGDASRKAADGFRRIAERFADLFRKFLLEALPCGRERSSRRRTQAPDLRGADRRLGGCRRAPALFRRGRVKQVQDGFRHIGERFVRDLAREPSVSARHPFGDQPKAQVASPSRGHASKA